jgi:hypothetical protein
LHKAAHIIGVSWMGLVVAYGVWLGFAGLFFDQGGIFFESGFGDIWILAICGVPGYLLMVWGKNRSGDAASSASRE